MKIKPDEYLKKLTCLYVEDDLSIQEPFSMMIKRYFQKVYVASNGKDGLELYKEVRPDIVLSDIRMPQMNGTEMVKAIKEEDSDAIVVFITAFSDNENLKEAIELGVDGYLTKPIDKQKMLKKLNQIAKNLKHKHEMEQYTALLKEVLDKQTQPLVVLELAEIKLKNKAFEEIFTQINTLKDLKEVTSIDFEDTQTQKISITIQENEHIFEVNIQRINQTFILISFNDITEFEEAIFTDQLTNVYNRKILGSVLKKMCHQKVFLAILDIDDFKQVNDTYGHLVGDEVLKKVAMTLKNSLRKDDVIIRWGGEEFVVILNKIEQEQLAIDRMEYLREKIESLSFEKVGHITCSFGLCNTVLDKKEDFEKLLSLADNALYMAKKKGKNKVEYCSNQDIKNNIEKSYIS